MKTSVVSHNLHNRRALAPACQAQPFPPLPGQFPGTPTSLPSFCLSTARLFPISEYLFLLFPQPKVLPPALCMAGSVLIAQISAPVLFPDLPVSHPSPRDSLTLTNLHTMFICLLPMISSEGRCQNPAECLVQMWHHMYLYKWNGLMKEFLVRRWGMEGTAGLCFVKGF